MTTKANTNEATKQRSTKARSKGTKTRVRAGWRLGTAKRADGTTGANACVCGCGTMVRGLFAQGHDARVHSLLLAVERGETKTGELPATVRRALDAGTIKHRERTSRVIGERKPKATKEAHAVAA